MKCLHSRAAFSCRPTLKEQTVKEWTHQSFWLCFQKRNIYFVLPLITEHAQLFLENVTPKKSSQAYFFFPKGKTQQEALRVWG